MNRAMILILAIALSAGLFCTKTEMPTTTTASVMPVQPDPYALPTTDRVAFSTMWPLDSGKTAYNHRFHGKVTALKDSSAWKGFTFLALFPDSSPLVTSIVVSVFSKTGQAVSDFSVSLPSKKPGIYTSGQEGVRFTYYDVEDNCANISAYKPDPNQVSFFRLVSYDPIKKEMKGRFRFHFVKTHQSPQHPPFPETIFFDDGAVVVRRVN